MGISTEADIQEILKKRVNFNTITQHRIKHVFNLTILN